MEYSSRPVESAVRSDHHRIGSVVCVRARNALQHSKFEISAIEEESPRISLAKYISRNLYIRYSRRLSRERPGSVIGVEYYFNDNVFFQAAQGVQGSQNEGISFDLNLNYEY